MKTFYQLLANTTLTSVINFTVWFAITFFVYLQTGSVFATGMISGIYLVLTAISGIWFGSLVDHYAKKHVILASSIVSLVLYGICFAIYITVGMNSFKNLASVDLWVFVLLLLIGVIVGNIRTIALPTIVTILIPENRRDKANGLVGSTVGISFLVTSIIS
jgi:MFS transporter, DHA3 family, multidrug efflux protein